MLVFVLDRLSKTTQPSNHPTVKVRDLREAVGSGDSMDVRVALEKRSHALEELMAQNAANGMGLLMLAVTTNKVHMLEYVACEIKTRVSTSVGCVSVLLMPSYVCDKVAH